MEGSYRTILEPRKQLNDYDQRMLHYQLVNHETSTSSLKHLVNTDFTFAILTKMCLIPSRMSSSAPSQHCCLAYCTPGSSCCEPRKNVQQNGPTVSDDLDTFLSPSLVFVQKIETDMNVSTYIVKTAETCKICEYKSMYTD